jgi:hypothetical protein
MKLSEIRNNPEILANLRWDLTPQTSSITGYTLTSQADFFRLNELLAQKAGYYFYVDVWNCQARLALMHNYANGNGRAEIVEDYDNVELLEASVDCITCSGHYPITAELEDDLRKKLYTSDFEAGGEWTAEKDALRKQLNREYAKFRREQKNMEKIGKPRIRKFGPKKRKTSE